MTALQGGRTVQCDYAACTRPGTVGRDAWWFCAEHAGKAADEQAPARPRPRPVLPSVPPVAALAADTALVLTRDGAHLEVWPAVLA